MLAYLRDSMARSSSRLEPFYGLQAADVQVAPDGDAPVTVTLRHVQDGQDTGETSTIRAKYVVGCDGARSAVRDAIGQELVGDADEPVLGRHGRPGRHRLPRHPAQVASSTRRTRATC